MAASKRGVICSYTGCGKEFTRRPDRARHEDEKHNPPKTCPYCNYAAKRRKRMRDHMSAKHGVDLEGSRLIIESTTASGEPSLDATSVIQSQGKFDVRKLNVASDTETDLAALFLEPDSLVATADAVYSTDLVATSTHPIDFDSWDNETQGSSNRQDVPQTWRKEPRGSSHGHVVWDHDPEQDQISSTRRGSGLVTSFSHALKPTTNTAHPGSNSIENEDILTEFEIDNFGEKVETGWWYI